MKACLFATAISTAAAGGSLSLSFKDCGAKHAVTTDVKPSTLQLGADTAITGTGSLDKAVSGGTYDMELKAGGGLIDSHFTGNNCEAKDFTLPLGLGTLSWDGIQCPLAAADSVSIGFHTKLASSLPAALATSDIHLAANDQDGESVLCVDLHLAKQKSLSKGRHEQHHDDTVNMGGQVFMEGFLEGFLGDAKYIKACVSESVEVAKDVAHLVADVKSRNLNKTISDFQALVTDAMADVKACRAIGKDLAPFMAAFKGVHSIKDLAKKLENNFLAHDEEILDLLEDMLEVCTFGAPDGHKCGVDAGKQVRSLVIGDTMVKTLQDVLESHSFADFLQGFTGDSKLSECLDKQSDSTECTDMYKDDKDLGPFMAGLSDVHGVKDLVHAILNALKQHFLDHDSEILDLLGDMTKVCTFAAPDGHKCAADLGRIVRSILFGNTVKTLQDVLESHGTDGFADFLQGFTGDSKLSECLDKVDSQSDSKIWTECKDMYKDDKDLGPFMAGLSDVHGVKDIVRAILNALKQHFLDHDSEILDLLGDMTKVCTFAAPDGHKCVADLGRIVRSILFGNTVVV